MSAGKRFTLHRGRRYAAELVGEEFGDRIRSYSPIRALTVAPSRSGLRQLALSFYHANYPEGVRDKRYTLATIERSRTFLFARSIDHDLIRLLMVYDISWRWLQMHFGKALSRELPDVQEWLSALLFPIGWPKSGLTFFGMPRPYIFPRCNLPLPRLFGQGRQHVDGDRR